MSFDLSIQTTCDHKIFKEPAELSPDRLSLWISRPISSVKSIKLYASDNLIPASMYDIVYDPASNQVNQAKMVLFKEKWRSPEDRFEVSYITINSYCPKCVGLGRLDDLYLGINGEYKIERNEALLLQNLEKWTITNLTSNPFHQFIGTSLVSLLGSKVTDEDYLISKISQEINRTLMKFMDLQTQYRSSGRAMTDGETLESINSIAVAIDESDPTIFRASITVTARSGKSISYTQVMRTARG